MKILALSGDTGSTYVIANALAKQWRANGHDVRLFAPVTRFNIRVLMHVLRYRYDVVHAHLGGAMQLAALLEQYIQLPALGTLHGFQKAKHARKLRHFTAVSETIKRHYTEDGLPSERIDVIANGVDPALANPPERTIRDMLGLPANATVLGTMAVFTPMKQHDLLLPAFAMLTREHPQLHLILAGEGPLKNDSLKLTQQLGLESKVHFVGFQHDQATFYHGLDYYIQPSRNEGFCMPIAEAMMAGIPVISTRNKAPEEYLVHGENALIVPDMKPESLAATLRQALAEHDSWPKRIARARQTVAPWHWPLIAAQYERKLHEVIACTR